MGSLYDGAKQYDTALLTLSSGALFLSIAFINEAVTGDPIAIELLKLSWGFFVGTIVLVLISFQTSQFAFNQELARVDRDYADNANNVPREESTAHKTTRCLNVFSGLCFFIGVALTTAFAVINI